MGFWLRKVFHQWVRCSPSPWLSSVPPPRHTKPTNRRPCQNNKSSFFYFLHILLQRTSMYGPPVSSLPTWDLQNRRKMRLIESNAKFRYLNKLTCKGTLRQVLICLSPPPPPPRLLFVSNSLMLAFKNALKKLKAKNHEKMHKNENTQN